MRRVDGDGVERFDSRVSVAQLERAAPVLRAIQAGASDADVLGLLRGGGGVAIGNILGGDFMWLADPSNAAATITDWPDMAPDQYATSWGRAAPGVVVRITVPPGPVSFQVSGGVGQAWISDSPIFDSPATSYGMGGSGWITSPGGIVYGVLRVATTSLDCRFERGAG